MTPREFATEVTQKLQAAGYQALWAGGCVRDQLLAKTPKDYDVATSAQPDQIRDLFGYKRTLTLGAAFGVITVIGPKSAGNIEIATFRQDAEYEDGRRPSSVQFSTAEMDAQRRDFTINGLFYDPVNETVIDYVGGKHDLEKRVIRAIGNPAERISEDKLRMLRAVRFAANLSFELDSTTLETIQKHAHEIIVVSMERISVELSRMLVHQNRTIAVQLLVDTHLLQNALPELANMVGTKLMDNCLSQLGRLSDPSLAVALAILYGPVAIESTSRDPFVDFCKRLKLPNDVAREGNWVLKNYRKLAEAKDARWSDVQPLLIAPFINSGLDALEAIAPDSPGLPFCREKLALPAEKLNPPALLDGDMLRRHDFQPGPDFKRILTGVRNAQLDGNVKNIEQALDLACSIRDLEIETDS